MRMLLKSCASAAGELADRLHLLRLAQLRLDLAARSVMSRPMKK